MRSRIVTTVLLIVAALFPATAAEARETYNGHVVPSTGTFPRTGSQRLVVTLERYSTPDETQRLVEALKAKGQKGLEKELWDLEVGRIRVGDRLSYPIATAQLHQDPELGTQRIVLLLSRPIAYAEIAKSSRSQQYPFTLVELDVDGAGTGSGEMIVAAKVEIRKDGVVELENLEAQPLRILKVQRTE